MLDDRPVVQVVQVGGARVVQRGWYESGDKVNLVVSGVLNW